jgi:hypothetical protein
VLFGGSAMIVFAVITLVKAAKEKGIPVADAALNNVPVFLNFSTIALVCAIGLLIAEALDFAKNKKPSKLVKIRWASSLIAIAATMVFSLGIVPPMKELLPVLRTNEQAHEKFEGLHKGSERTFGVIILFALLSLVLPAFDKPSRLAESGSVAA